MAWVVFGPTSLASITSSTCSRMAGSISFLPWKSAVRRAMNPPRVAARPLRSPATSLRGLAPAEERRLATASAPARRRLVRLRRAALGGGRRRRAASGGGLAVRRRVFAAGRCSASRGGCGRASSGRAGGGALKLRRASRPRTSRSTTTATTTSATTMATVVMGGVRARYAAARDYRDPGRAPSTRSGAVGRGRPAVALGTAGFGRGPGDPTSAALPRRTDGRSP